MTDRPVRALIVDDVAMNLKLLVALLKANNFVVSTAESAEDAEPVLASERFDVLLLDLRLPGLDGLSFARKLRADPAYRELVIVAVTANAMKNDEASALAAGCDGYVTKPVNTRTFVPYIRALLAKERPA